MSCSVFAGCVAVPFYTSLRGPIRTIRVLDAETGSDIPGANVSLMSQKSERFLGPPPSTLTCPSLFEIQAARRGHLLRNDDGSFHASWGLVEGSHGICVTQKGDANEYPRGILTVDAPGYRATKLRYTAGQVKPGWSCTEVADSDDSSAAGDHQADASANGQNMNRCDFQDGVLRFYLHRQTSPEPSAPASEEAAPGL